MRIYRAIVEIVIISDDIFHERFTLDHSLHIADQIFEDRELGLGELELLARESRDVTLGIDFDIAEAEIFSVFHFFSLFGTLRNCRDTSDELSWREGLRDVVVGSEFEKCDFIIFAFSC